MLCSLQNTLADFATNSSQSLIFAPESIFEGYHDTFILFAEKIDCELIMCDLGVIKRTAVIQFVKGMFN